MHVCGYNLNRSYYDVTKGTVFGTTTTITTTSFSETILARKFHFTLIFSPALCILQLSAGAEWWQVVTPVFPWNAVIVGRRRRRIMRDWTFVSVFVVALFSTLVALWCVSSMDCCWCLHLHIYLLHSTHVIPPKVLRNVMHVLGVRPLDPRTNLRMFTPDHVVVRFCCGN